MKTPVRLSFLLLCGVLAFGCGGPSLVGKYSIQQENNAFGEGAEKGTLDLREDGSYDLTMGPVTLFKGTWKAEGQNLTVTNEAGGAMALNYKVDGSNLIPMKDGKEITFWKFVKK